VIRALAENRRPGSKTALMFAPYWNCDGAGRVCQGSMRVPGSLCLEAMEARESAFFESEFTHAANGARLTTHPEGFLGLLARLDEQRGSVPFGVAR
jgi:PRTRC genetic system protein B